MDALMPLASMPIEIAGRNRIMRKMIMDADDSINPPELGVMEREIKREERSIRPVTDYRSNSRARHTYHRFNLAGLSQGTAGKLESNKRQINTNAHSTLTFSSLGYLLRPPKQGVSNSLLLKGDLR